MSNILKGLLRIAENPITEIVNYYAGRNRVNNVGVGLEVYIQDILAGTLDETDENKRNLKISQTFSYTGNTNNPPDLMLRGGDALEVKKIESFRAGIALNSSHPKSKLFNSDSRISDDCNNCEKWSEKDIIYCIGHTKKKLLKHLWLIYGDCYAANKETYENMQSILKKGIDDIEELEFSETNELGRVNRVDPLGITILRIRGMWHIDNPIKVFDYLYEFNKENDFGLACLMRKTKFESFPEETIKLVNENEMLTTNEVKIKNPNNPAEMIDAVLITLEVKS